MSLPAYASVQDVTTLFRPLTNDEQSKVGALLPIVSDALRLEAQKVGKNLDEMIENDNTGGALANVAKSVTVDIVSRMITADTNSEAMSQFSQSALGYTVSGTYLSPGGGLFIKKAELARLGLRRQKVGVINIGYDH